MLWFWLALASALAFATADALTKKHFSDLAPLEMGYVRLAYSAPILLLPFLAAPVPELPPGFWLVVALLVPFETAALFLYMRALQVSPLSLTIPFLAFTPVWVILVGWLLLGELPNLWGAAGILLVAAGAYLLNLNARRHGLLGPARAVFREPGSWMMLLVSGLYALTITLGKKAILLSSLLYFGTMYFLLLTAVLGLTLGATGRLRLRPLLRRPGWGLAIGLATAVMILTHVWSITLTRVAYMVAVKRLSLVFAVLYGRVLFGETEFGQRLAGAALMFSGVALIGLLG